MDEERGLGNVVSATSAFALDYRRLQFPSDSITIATIRLHEPNRIDCDLPHLSTDEADSIEALLFYERVIAKEAFANAVEVTPAHSHVVRREESREYEAGLIHEYKFYGIVNTTEQGMELIAGIREQACELARKARDHKPTRGEYSRGR